MVGERRSLVVPVADAAIAVHQRNGRAPVVVFEAGLGLPGSCWRPVLAHLPADRGFVYYDRPGLGASRGGRRPRTAGRQLGELRELLGALDLPPPYVLVAHSAGAFVAWLYLMRHPAEVAGVVLVDPSATDEPAQPRRLTDRLIDLATDGLLYGGSVVARTGLLKAGWRWARRSRRLRERYRPEFISLVGQMISPRHLLTVARENAAFPASRAQVRRELRSRPAPDVPMVVVTAGRGSSLPQQRESAAQAVWSPDRRQVSVPGAGHLVMLDAPAVVAQAIAEIS
jgi:pimeloyl-ACP methyl ester carboxylesterase